MIVIDLRKLETDILLNKLEEYYNQIRGNSLVIYTIPDEIWVSKDQFFKYKEFGISLSYKEVPIKIKDDDPTNI